MNLDPTQLWLSIAFVVIAFAHLVLIFGSRIGNFLYRRKMLALRQHSDHELDLLREEDPEGWLVIQLRFIVEQAAWHGYEVEVRQVSKKPFAMRNKYTEVGVHKMLVRDLDQPEHPLMKHARRVQFMQSPIRTRSE